MAKTVRLLLLCLSLSWTLLGTSACTACVQLTEYTFDKVIGKFDAALVKFDVAFPYGEKHETYSEFAKDAKSADDFLVAEVGIKDYGERDNEVIAKRFGIVKDDYPVVKLFLRGKKEPLTFPAAKEFTVDTLRRFVKAEAGVHLSLPGCLPELDKIAFKFVKAKGDERKKQLKKLKDAAATLDKEKKATAKTYQIIMEKIIEKGDGFIESENSRVKKLLDGKIAPEKKKELNNKLNILLSFNNKETNDKKDEL